jgi:hypothetical protein
VTESTPRTDAAIVPAVRRVADYLRLDIKDIPVELHMVNAPFARSLERQCARQSALLREVSVYRLRRDLRERIERELKG